MTTSPAGPPPHPKPPGTAKSEWFVAGLSALVVMGAIGYLVYDGARSPSTPPNVTIEVASVTRSGPGYLVEFRARNAGRGTAAELLVEGELRADTGSVEVSQATIDYLPPLGVRRAGLFFTHDPQRYELRLRPLGYEIP